jgi:hypothetical protein
LEENQQKAKKNTVNKRQRKGEGEMKEESYSR